MAAMFAAANNDWERARWEGEALMRKARGQDAWRPRFVIDCVLWPLLLFCHIYYWSFGGWRYRDWRLAMCLAFLGVAVCVGSTWVTLLMFRRQVPCRRWIALSACLWLACFGGFCAGDQNYGHHMVSFYTYQDLVSYTDLDPAVAKGQSFMDSGEVYFKEGTTVDTNEMVSFRNRLNFCAAPILGQPLRNQKVLHEVAREGDFVMPESGTVDFWAVGTDCCDKATREFTCGEASNKRARAGMRMIREDHRPFYLLAIQEWTARMCPTSGEDNTAQGHSKAAPLLCIPSRHPLLFTWVEDPVGEVRKYYEQALWRFEMDVVVFLMMDIFIALGALLALKELGFK